VIVRDACESLAHPPRGKRVPPSDYVAEVGTPPMAWPSTIRMAPVRSRLDRVLCLLRLSPPGCAPTSAAHTATTRLKRTPTTRRRAAA